MAAACLTDWVVDRFLETPWPLRYFLATVQVLLTVFILSVWVFGPVLRRLSDNRLALWVEDKKPELSHRLISTVQLNQPGAKIQGMSKELIVVVTRETVQQTGTMNFGAVADHRRLKWSAGVVGPAVLTALGLLVLMPEDFKALLARQLLFDRDIPRQYKVVSVTRTIWPAGEEVELHFRVKGPNLGQHLSGSTTIFPQDQGSESFELEFSKMEGTDEALYIARVPPMSANFGFRAYIGDARLANVGYVKYVPRPVITEQEAWVLLRFGNRGKELKTPYPQKQVRGDIVSLPGQQARGASWCRSRSRRRRWNCWGRPCPTCRHRLAIAIRRPETSKPCSTACASNWAGRRWRVFCKPLPGANRCCGPST